MVQKVNVVIVDDLDGSDADETVRFSLDGVDYEMDLSAKNADRLRKSLAGYVDKARRTSGRRSGSRRGRSRGAKGSAGGSGASPAEMREWARAEGWDIPERGRIAAEVRAAFDAAH